MTPEQSVALVGGAVNLVVTMVSVLIVPGLIVGLVVSIFQAATQIQEQTLVYVPKVAAIFGSLLFFMPFMSDALAAYMARIAARIALGH